MREERFCQLMKQGIPPYRAYPMAGFKFHHGNPYRMRESERVKARLNEIGRQMSRKTEYTIEKALLHLEEDRDLARSLEQPGAAIAATQLCTKLVGLLVDRKESGSPGEFAGLQSAADVLALVRSELGNSTADALAVVLQGHEAAAIVPDVLPSDTLN